MRKKLPVLMLALLILLQAFVPAVYAASENEAISSSIYFCPFDTTSEGAGELGGQGFITFNLKKALGSPGDNKAWHHIVEKSQINKSGFSPTQIHNTENIIAVDSATHAKISGFYSSKPEFAQGKTVRDWLSGQSYQEQYRFGMDVLKRFGVNK